MENTKLLELTKINYQTYYERRLFSLNKKITTFTSFDELNKETQEIWLKTTEKLITLISGRLTDLCAFNDLTFNDHLNYLALRNYESHERLTWGSSADCDFNALHSSSKDAWLKATEAVLRNVTKILTDIADSNGTF